MDVKMFTILALLLGCLALPGALAVMLASVVWDSLAAALREDIRVTPIDPWIPFNRSFAPRGYIVFFTWIAVAIAAAFGAAAYAHWRYRLHPGDIPLVAVCLACGYLQGGFLTAGSVLLLCRGAASKAGLAISAFVLGIVLHLFCALAGGGGLFMLGSFYFESEIFVFHLLATAGLLSALIGYWAFIHNFTTWFCDGPGAGLAERLYREKVGEKGAI